MAYSIFTRDDIADFKEVFEYFDHNNIGFIKAKQLRTTLRALTPKPKESDIQVLMNDITKRNNDRVNFRKYLDTLHATIEVNRKQQIRKNKPRRKRSCYTNLNQEQLSDIREAFDMFDQNGDGTISTEELRGMMTTLGQQVSDADIREMLGEVDTDENGNLNYPAFMTLMTRKVAATDLNNEIREAFRFFDQDDDGSITADELKLCMKKIGEDLTDDELSEMVKEADLDGNGKIDYAEFVKMITWPKS